VPGGSSLYTTSFTMRTEGRQFLKILSLQMYTPGEKFNALASILNYLNLKGKLSYEVDVFLISHAAA